MPAGRHGLSRDYVSENQRERILEAVIRAAAELGYGDLTVEAVVSRAGVSRRTFYQHFKNREDAFLGAYDAVVARLMAAVDRADDVEAGLVKRIELALRAVLAVLAEDPAAAVVLMVESGAAGEESLKRRNSMLRSLIERVQDATGAKGGSGRPMPTIIAESVVGGISEVIYNRVLGGEPERLPELLPDLMYCALLPYIGPDAAAAEHRRLSGG